jgi:RNA polymerase sigma factor (sigma-70 family)
MTDTNQLLREYIETGSEPAFREIVARYVDLVYSVALRRINGHEDLARDVVQTVFTDLARKANRLRAESCLGGWLHRHACFVSSTIWRAEQRRLAREQIAVEMNQNEPSEAAWQQLAPMLDEAVDQLGDADRQAIILRFYERRDLRSIGAALGTTEDAAQKRLSRALEKLRTCMASKGVTLSVAALMSVLLARAVTAAPAGLAAQAAESALAASATGGIVATLITLMTALKIPLALGTAALAVVAGAFLYHNSRTHPSSNESTPRADLALQADSAAAPGADGTATLSATSAEPATGPTVAAEPNVLRLTIIAADSGKPVPGVRISYRGWEKEKFTGKQFVSSRSGLCDVVVPRASITHLELTSIAEGFADTRLDWQTDRGETIPMAYSLRLTRPVLISGRVLDPDGQPLAGAKMGWNHNEEPAFETRPESHRFGWIEVETDTDGRWQINRIAPEMVRLLYGTPHHVEYVSPPLLMVSEKPATTQQLREGTHVFRMGRALSISGTVFDPDGTPVAGAGVRVGGVGESSRRETTTLADGTFVVGGCKAGKNVVTAESAGFAPASVEIDLTATSGPVRLVLQKGKTLKLRLVDKAGQPIVGANVWYDTMRQMRAQTTKPSAPTVQVEFSPLTDAEGRAVWNGAPGGDLYFSFAKTGYMRRDEVLLPADGQEHVVTLSPALVVFGTVRDADTGEPISKFRIACGWPNQAIDGEIRPQFSGIDRFWLSFANGEFRHSFEEPLIMGTPGNPGYMLRFEADGYARFLSRVIKEEEGEVKLEVKLSKATDLPVTVLRPDGQPAAGIELAMIASGRDLQLIPGGFSKRNSDSGGLLQTDAQGVFKLPPDDSVQQVIAAGLAGYGHATPAALRAEPTLRLESWGRIEGAFASGSKAAKRTLNLDPLERGPASVRFEFRAFQVPTDEQGHFTFPQVPPGTWKLVRLIESKDGEHTVWSQIPLQDVEVQAGQTTQLTLGVNARPVVARVSLPSGVTRQPESRMFAFVHTPFVKPPAELQKDPEAFQRWAQSPEVRAQIANTRSYPLKEASAGTWTGEEVPPGDYILTVNLLGKPEPDGSAKSLAIAEVPVTISAGNTAEAFDAGVIALQPAP